MGSVFSYLSFESRAYELKAANPCSISVRPMVSMPSKVVNGDSETEKEDIAAQVKARHSKNSKF